MRVEDVFDLRIATVEPGEAPPPDADLVRVESPAPGDVARLTARGWFHKPCCVTYVLVTPPTLEAYVERCFRAGARGRPRRLLREVPRRYRLEIGEDGRGAEAFAELYRRAIASRPLGLDRLAARAHRFGKGWTGFYLFDGRALAAGVMVRAFRDRLSAAYVAVEPARRAQDLEHYLLMEVIARAAARGVPRVSLGRDTNRYGHHLPLGLPAYKLGIGFAPRAYEPSGRELLKVQSLAAFPGGLFFYGYGEDGLVGHLLARGEPDPRPFTRRGAPPVSARRL